MNNETSRKVLIVSASIGTGHMQAARAIEEYWKEKEPQASITHVDFLDTETMSVEHLIKGTYIKMIDVFPMLYDMIYRVSKGEKRGTIMQTALSYLLKSRMLKLVQQEDPAQHRPADQPDRHGRRLRQHRAFYRAVQGA